MADFRPDAAGASLVIKGTVTATEDILLSGRVEGSVCAPHHVVTIGPYGHVQAEIEARAVVVGGTVTGSLRATEKVVLDDGATVAGDVRAPRVEMRDGAHVRGRIDMPARIRSVTSAA